MYTPSFFSLKPPTASSAHHHPVSVLSSITKQDPPSSPPSQSSSSEPTSPGRSVTTAASAAATAATSASKMSSPPAMIIPTSVAASSGGGGGAGALSSSSSSAAAALPAPNLLFQTLASQHPRIVSSPPSTMVHGFEDDEHSHESPNRSNDQSTPFHQAYLQNQPRSPDYGFSSPTISAREHYNSPPERRQSLTDPHELSAGNLFNTASNRQSSPPPPSSSLYLPAPPSSSSEYLFRVAQQQHHQQPQQQQQYAPLRSSSEGGLGWRQDHEKALLAAEMAAVLRPSAPPAVVESFSSSSVGWKEVAEKAEREKRETRDYLVEVLRRNEALAEENSRLLLGGGDSPFIQQQQQQQQQQLQTHQQQQQYHFPSGASVPSFLKPYWNPTRDLDNTRHSNNNNSNNNVGSQQGNLSGSNQSFASVNNNNNNNNNTNSSMVSSNEVPVLKLQVQQLLQEKNEIGKYVGGLMEQVERLEKDIRQRLERELSQLSQSKMDLQQENSTLLTEKRRLEDELRDAKNRLSLVEAKAVNVDREKEVRASLESALEEAKRELVQLKQTSQVAKDAAVETACVIATRKIREELGEVIGELEQRLFESESKRRECERREMDAIQRADDAEREAEKSRILYTKAQLEGEEMRKREILMKEGQINSEMGRLRALNAELAEKNALLEKRSVEVHWALSNSLSPADKNQVLLSMNRASSLLQSALIAAQERISPFYLDYQREVALRRADELIIQLQQEQRARQTAEETISKLLKDGRSQQAHYSDLEGLLRALRAFSGSNFDVLAPAPAAFVSSTAIAPPPASAASVLRLAQEEITKYKQGIEEKKSAVVAVKQTPTNQSAFSFSPLSHVFSPAPSSVGGKAQSGSGIFSSANNNNNNTQSPFWKSLGRRRDEPQQQQSASKTRNSLGGAGLFSTTTTTTTATLTAPSLNMNAVEGATPSRRSPERERISNVIEEEEEVEYSHVVENSGNNSNEDDSSNRVSSSFEKLAVGLSPAPMAQSDAEFILQQVRAGRQKFKEEIYKDLSGKE